MFRTPANHISLPLFAILFAWLGVICVTPTFAAPQLLIDQEIGAFEEIAEPWDDEPITMGAVFMMKPNSREGVLVIKARIAEGWHLYSVTQPEGGPLRSTFSPDPDLLTVQGAFQPDKPPHVDKEPEAFGDVDVESHEVEVTWTAPIRLSGQGDVESLEIPISYSGQTCNPEGCIPVDIDLTAEFAGFLKADEEEFVPESHLQLEGTVSSDGPVKAGSKITISITATPEPTYHIYAYQKKPAMNKTLIAMDRNNGWEVGEVTASAKPIEHETAGIQELYHEDPITWTFEVTVPEKVKDETYGLSGLLGFQTCYPTGCDKPEAARFSFEVAIGETIPEDKKLDWKSEGDFSDVQSALETLQKTAANEAAASKPKINSAGSVASPEEIAEMATYYDADSEINWVALDDIRRNQGQTVAPPKKTTLWTALVGAFLGGMLLNLMPCVFPVLGIKVLGFVQQAGSEPAKIRMHGLAFGAGLIVSMWVLAGIILAIREIAGAEVNWGMQMGNPYFVGSMILLMFVLGLNMAGVFEIGTSLTRAGGAKIAHKKGYSGSFFSGVLTTIVATPCSGPFLGVAMGYTLSQTVPLAMFLFTVFGLGIAAPYIVLAFFPVLINMLPKPGAWMETFKVTMSFALFATAAFFMQTFGAQTGVDGLSWLVMAMVVIGLALYFYGRWSLPHISFGKRIGAGTLMPAALIFVGLYMSYSASGYPPPPKSADEWLHWYPGRVEYTLAKTNKMVLVDYTADW